LMTTQPKQANNQILELKYAIYLLLMHMHEQHIYHTKCRICDEFRTKHISCKCN
jgi:hypothetical protein